MENKTNKLYNRALEMQNSVTMKGQKFLAEVLESLNPKDMPSVINKLKRSDINSYGLPQNQAKLLNESLI